MRTKHIMWSIGSKMIITQIFCIVNCMHAVRVQWTRVYKVAFAKQEMTKGGWSKSPTVCWLPPAQQQREHIILYIFVIDLALAEGSQEWGAGLGMGKCRTE